MHTKFLALIVLKTFEKGAQICYLHPFLLLLEKKVLVVNDRHVDGVTVRARAGMYTRENLESFPQEEWVNFYPMQFFFQGAQSNSLRT